MDNSIQKARIPLRGYPYAVRDTAKLLKGGKLVDNKQDDKNKKNRNLINWVIIGVIALIVMLFFNYLSQRTLRESPAAENNI